MLKSALHILIVAVLTTSIMGPTVMNYLDMATENVWMDQLPDEKGEKEKQEKDKLEKEFIFYSFLRRSVAPYTLQVDNYDQFDSRLTIGIKSIDLPPPEALS